jgi:hypothetical protein
LIGWEAEALQDRFDLIRYASYNFTGAPTETFKQQFEIVQKLYKLYKISYEAIKIQEEKSENRLKQIGAAYIVE